MRSIITSKPLKKIIDGVVALYSAQIYCKANKQQLLENAAARREFCPTHFLWGQKKGP